MGNVVKRHITVNDSKYIWTLKGNRIDGPPQHIKVHQEKNNASILYIDPYSWSFEIRPEFIRKAILFALENDWQPCQGSKNFYISMKGSDFILLPHGVRFGYELE